MGFRAGCRKLFKLLIDINQPRSQGGPVEVIDNQRPGISDEL
jgi:hypothetical protein